MDKILLNSADRHLCKVDKTMARLIKQCDPITLSKTKPPHYHALVDAIINQQLSIKAGRTISNRLLSIHGGRYFNAETMLKLKAIVLRECGLSNNKVNYVRSLAQAIVDGELNFRKLSRLGDEDVRQALIQYPGIGLWSADIFLITSMRRMDVFPVGDLVIRKTIQRYYQVSDDAKYEEYNLIADSWRPYRTIASLYLWKAGHQK